MDNGSTDTSAEIAAAHGATVVYEPRRGYGQAYLTGIDNARGEYVVMADADGTYPVNELGAFVDRSKRATTSSSARASRGGSTRARCRGRTAGSATRS